MSAPLHDSSKDENADLPPCVRCGACCYGDNPQYLRVSGDDHARMGELAETLVVFHGHRAFMRMSEEGHCAALEVRPGAAEHVCTIYELRPTVCRELGRGSAECAGERTTKGARPGALVKLRLSRRETDPTP